MINVKGFNSKNIPLKMVIYKDWTENEGTSSQCPLKKTLKYFQNAWRSIAQDHFEKLQQSHSLEATYKEMRGGSRPLHSTIDYNLEKRRNANECDG